MARVTIQYQCHDIGHGSEEGEATGIWGEVDTWGKRAFFHRGPTLYLFADEVVSQKPAPLDESAAHANRTKLIRIVELLEAAAAVADELNCSGEWAEDDFLFNPSAFIEGVKANAEEALRSVEFELWRAVREV